MRDYSRRLAKLETHADAVHHPAEPWTVIVRHTIVDPDGTETPLPPTFYRNGVLVEALAS